MANCEQGIHPVGSFVDLVVLITAGVVLPHSQDEVEDSDEGPDSVRVPPEHHVTETNVVACRDVACCNSC